MYPHITKMTIQAGSSQIIFNRMGERIGYRTRDKNGTSQIIRKQWMKNVKDVVTDTWNTLGGNPDNGWQAIRNDLENDRAFAALVVSVYDPPFDSIHENTDCDISDHGLVEIDVTNYKDWKIYHIPVPWEEGQKFDENNKTLYGNMNTKGWKHLKKVDELDWD